MKRSIAILAALLLTVGMVSCAFAAKTIYIENNTGIAISEIYLSGASTDDWEDDILGKEVLQPGEAWQIDISGSHPYWDIKMIGENGSEAVFYEVDFNKYTTITLNKDGSATGK